MQVLKPDIGTPAGIHPPPFASSNVRRAGRHAEGHVHDGESDEEGSVVGGRGATTLNARPAACREAGGMP